MHDLTVQKRIIAYLSLLPQTTVSVFFMSLLVIAFSGDRELGMIYGLGLGLMIAPIFTAKFFFREKISRSIFAGLTIGLTSLLASVLLGTIIKNQLDFYGYFAVISFYVLTSIMLWESYYRIRLKFNKNQKIESLPQQ